MIYFFTVQAVDQQGRVLWEVDLPVSQFQPLLEACAQLLRELGLFTQNETLLLRLAPSSTAITDLTVGTLVDFPTTLDDGDYQVYIDKALIAPEAIVQSLALWVCAPDRQQAYAIQLPIGWLLSSVTAAFEEQGRARTAPEAAVDWQLIVHLPPEETVLQSQAPGAEAPLSVVLLLTGGSRAIDQYEDDSVRGDEAAAVVDITTRTPLIDIAEKAWESYKPLLQGIRQRGDLRVLFHQPAWARLQQLATDMAAENREGVGLLFGQIYQTEKAELFVDIQMTVPLTLAPRLFLSTTSDVKQWQKALATAQATVSNQIVVGWYRIEAAAVWRLSLLRGSKANEQSTTAIATTAPLLATSDQRLQQKLFTKPWQVALIMAPTEKQYLFYQWKREQLVACQGYYLYDTMAETGVNP